jgi:tRNA A-37 threonylcarbamoyl transferase component Bud32
MQNTYKVVAYGRTAELLQYDDRHVLKLFKPGIPSNLPEEEFVISQLVYQSGIQAPKPVDLIEWNERKGIIYQKIAGPTMLQAIRMNPWSIRKQASRMAEIHVKVHSKSIMDLPEQKGVMTDKIKQASLLTENEKKTVLAYLTDLKEDTKLCHGDFHPDNILLGASTWTIDWMTGAKGNPAGDVARTMLLLELGTLPDETPKLIGYLFTVIRKILSRNYVRHYLKYSSLQYEEIEKWLVPVAAARLTEWIPEKEKNKLVALIRKRLSM